MGQPRERGRGRESSNCSIGMAAGVDTRASAPQSQWRTNSPQQSPTWKGALPAGRAPSAKKGYQRPPVTYPDQYAAAHTPWLLA